MKIALRVDVDTLRGTRIGVPNLLRLMDRHSIRAAYFFSLGPDNMGRNLWRLLKPEFLWKMLRTRAASLYGWDILLMGTAWPGPEIGKRCADIIRASDRSGHEIGLHAWDHFTWQRSIEKMSADEIHSHYARGYDTLAGIIGRNPDCSSVPGWRCTEQSLLENEKFGFKYSSDVRGVSIFLPKIKGVQLKTVQIPRDLPTFDEVIGINEINVSNFNQKMLDMVREDGINLLTIHAEVEGIKYLDLFEKFVKAAKDRGYEFIVPGELLQYIGKPGTGSIIKREMIGREGWQTLQY